MEMKKYTPAEVMKLKPNLAMENALAQMDLDAEYTFQILAPSGIPAHKIRFSYEDGVLKGTYVTEHKEQEMRELTRSGCDISFKADAGSHGDEVFYTRLRLYQGGIMLGTTLQLRTDDVCAPSPVLCTSADPAWEMKR